MYKYHTIGVYIHCTKFTRTHCGNPDSYRLGLSGGMLAGTCSANFLFSKIDTLYNNIPPVQSLTFLVTNYHLQGWY